MNFQELIKNKHDKRFSEEFTQDLNNFESYVLGMMDCRVAIIDLLIKINDENYNAHGEYVNQSCREEAEIIERIINLIKYGSEYE